MTSIKLYEVAASALDAGKYSLAESDATKSLVLVPGEEIPLAILAAAFDDEGKVSEALSTYATLRSQGAWQGRVLLPYALLLLKNGDYNQALAVYERALPFISSYIYNGPQILSEDSDFLPDTQDERHLEANIRIALGWTYDTGTTWAGHSQAMKALPEYSRAYALENDSPVACIAYATGLKEAGRNVEARAILQKAISNSKGDVKETASDELQLVPKTDRPNPRIDK
jgi:tetratricopeptide (TPR) repeat protein